MIMADNVIKRISGTGEAGYLDGEPVTARFSKPRSFAIDLKGNVYVADKNNNVIRKITDSGLSCLFSLLCSVFVGVLFLLLLLFYTF